MGSSIGYHDSEKLRRLQSGSRSASGPTKSLQAAIWSQEPHHRQRLLLRAHRSKYQTRIPCLVSRHRCRACDRFPSDWPRPRHLGCNRQAFSWAGDFAAR